jgi:hypothetical protein
MEYYIVFKRHYDLFHNLDNKSQRKIRLRMWRSRGRDHAICTVATRTTAWDSWWTAHKKDRTQIRFTIGWTIDPLGINIKLQDKTNSYRFASATSWECPRYWGHSWPEGVVLLTSHGITDAVPWPAIKILVTQPWNVFYFLTDVVTS